MNTPKDTQTKMSLVILEIVIENERKWTLNLARFLVEKLCLSVTYLKR